MTFFNLFLAKKSAPRLIYDLRKKDNEAFKKAGRAAPVVKLEKKE